MDGQEPGDCGCQRNTGLIEQANRHETEHKRSIVPEPVVLVGNEQQNDKGPDEVPFHGNNKFGG